MKNRDRDFLGMLLDSKAKEKKECQDVRSLATRGSWEAGLRKWLQDDGGDPSGTQCLEGRRIRAEEPGHPAHPRSESER